MLVLFLKIYGACSSSELLVTSVYEAWFILQAYGLNTLYFAKEERVLLHDSIYTSYNVHFNLNVI